MPSFIETHQSRIYFHKTYRNKFIYYNTFILVSTQRILFTLHNFNLSSHGAI